jgi:transcriptional regulator with XRE-family HTH domain
VHGSSIDLVPKQVPLHSPRYRRFLQRLRAARLAAGLTQAQVAKALGKPLSYVSKCELGERRVDFVEAVDFASLYGKKLSYFAGD